MLCNVTRWRRKASTPPPAAADSRPDPTTRPEPTPEPEPPLEPPPEPAPDEHRLAGLSQELLRLTTEVSRNHSLLVEVQGTVRRLQETQLSFSERAGALALADAIRPRQVRGQQLMRVGSAHDGGYVLLDDYDTASGVLSGGAGDNVDFEIQLAQAGLDVHVYDHTVEQLPDAAGDPRITFVHEPLGPEGVDLAAAIARLGSEGADLLLKVDIDGGEWDLFAAAADVLPRFRQIALELHGLHQVGDALWRERALEALSVVNRTHAPVHVHPNNHGAYAIVGGVPLPDIIEVTFARRDAYQLVDDDTVSRPTLDQPNDPRRPEYSLGLFGAATVAAGSDAGRPAPPQ